MTIEAEQFVLGGLMLLNDLSSGQAEKVMSMLSVASFSDVDNQIVFAALRNLADRNGAADFFTVAEQCKQDKRYTPKLDQYVGTLCMNTPTAANIVFYAESVKASAVERYAVSQLQQAIATITDKRSGDIYQRLGLAESMIAAIQDRATRNRGLRHVGDVAREWLDSVETRLDGKQRGFTLGLDAIDRLLYPKRIPEGSLVVIGARPKMGKTAFLVHIANHFGLDRKESVAVFSLEMPDQQIFERMVVDRAKVDPAIFYKAANDADDWSAVSRVAGQFKTSQLYVDDSPGVRLAHIQREARNLNKKHKVGMVAVDYLTLMEAEKADRNDLAYGVITKGLKNLAKELGCVVLLLTQLNRALEARSDKRPMPSDSRDTGQIEQDCDLWIGLYRDAVYHDDAKSEVLTEAIVRLNRHGKTGTVYFNSIDGTVREVDQDEAARLNEKPTKVGRIGY